MRPTWQIQPDSTEGAYGRITADLRVCQPLDVVTVRVAGRDKGDTQCRVRVCDPEQRPYVECDLDLHDNQGVTEFRAGGQLGTHYIYLIWPDETRAHSRYVNFRLDAQTRIETGDLDLDTLYPRTRDAMLLGRREYATLAGKFVGYISADTWHFDGIWLRDWIYGNAAYRYWERDMTCGLDRFLSQQTPDGMIPDGIERDGRTWRVGLESDVEYIMVLGVWQAWQASGDDDWMAAALPCLELALRYIQSDPKHWDPDQRLIKRQHSCDTWDFDIDGAREEGTRRHVIATCDQSGYVQAFSAMGMMYRHLANDAAADRWTESAAEYRARANALLWDGVKFQHHVHLDSIDHGDFDERAQLAMGNTWAMTRGLAEPEQARSIIDEYQRRHASTGDAYPWWSLQPGYPNHLGYFHETHRQQGGYANGGLMPWVGGELCRAAFSFGRETYAVGLLRAYVDHLNRTGGAHVWYWPDGTPGFRTTNEVPYAGWGMAQWVAALIEGLAGITDMSACLGHASICPRWSAAGIRKARACVRYAASAGYVAYAVETDPRETSIQITFTGSGEQAEFRVLVPAERRAVAVTIDGQSTEYTLATEDHSRYVCFTASLAGVRCAAIYLQP